MFTFVALFMKSFFNNIYIVIRTVILIGIVGAAAVFISVYLLLLFPEFQGKVKTVAETELSKLLDTEIDIEKVSFEPFTKVALNDVCIHDKTGEKLLTVEKLAVGVSVYNLVLRKRLVFTYAEVMGLDARLTKATPQSELNVQFNTRRQLLLKSIYAYVSQKKTLLDHSCISLFGTTSFNLVWEKVCATIFDNKLNTALGRLKLPIPLKDGYKKSIKLIDVIEKPQWSARNDAGTIYTKEAQDTLIPDLIGLYNIGGKNMFVIFDAKYYCLQMDEDKPLRGQPGIESITKQYLYQLAYQQFINDHQFDIVKNCFLMPTEQDTIVDKGIASLAILSNLSLEPILVRLLPAKMVYKHYLEQTLFKVEELSL